MANHEKKEYCESVDLLMAFQRKKDGEPQAKCIRTIIRDYDVDLACLETKLKLLGGHWRIHRTVNSRDVEKARKWLIKKLIDNPEQAGFVDSLWRTALLQPECIYGEKKFLLDVDTKNKEALLVLDQRIYFSAGAVIKKIETPNGGRHIITNPFDTREVCKLLYVTLIRDGYYFIKEIK